MKQTPNFSLGPASEVIGLVITCGFLVSITYDWGYLRSFGLSFSDVSTTIPDHFRTGLIWFPPLAALFILYFTIEFQFQRIERGLSEDEIASASKSPERTKTFREFPYRLVAWICLLAIFAYLLIGELFAAVPAGAFAIIWFIFADWCYDTPLIRLRRSKYVQLAFALLPAILMVAYFSGRSDAASAAYQNPETVKLFQSNESKSEEFTFLRVFDRGVLLLSTESNVRFIFWSDIRSYEFRKGYQPYKGLLCIFDVLCPPDS